MGNVMVQAFAQDQVGSLEEIRAVVRDSFEASTYEPGGDAEEWSGLRERFSRLIEEASALDIPKEDRALKSTDGRRRTTPWSSPGGRAGWTWRASKSGCAPRGWRPPPGATATRARASRSSRRRACPATRSRRWPTRPRCTGSPACAPRWRSTSPGTRSTTTAKLKGHAESLGLRIGAVNPNLFQEPRVQARERLQPGSGRAAQGHGPPPRVRRR